MSDSIFGRVLACALLTTAAFGQEHSDPVAGIRNVAPRVHAFVDARVFVTPDKVLDGATVVFRDGVIMAAGPAVRAPADARIHDCKGLTVYAGLVEPYLVSNAEPGPGSHWNPAVHPEFHAGEATAVDTKLRSELRGLGFTTALVVPGKGIFRGTSSFVSLGDDTTGRRLIKARVAQHVAFERSGKRDRYPNSLMGAIALIRQTLLDADWYARVRAAYASDPRGIERPELNAALAALTPATPLVIEVGDDLDALRAARIFREFHLPAWLRGSGREYRVASKLDGIELIVPLSFPEPPAVDTAADARDVSLAALRDWKRAPENPARLYAAGVHFSLTSSGLAKRERFDERVREAVERGLPAREALRALTLAPARQLGVADRFGSIEAGKVANFVVTDGDLFAENTVVRETWIDGRRYVVHAARPPVRGHWKLAIGERFFDVVVEGGRKLRGTIARAGADPVDLREVRTDGRRVVLVFPGKELGLDGVVRLAGRVRGTKAHGDGELGDGSRVAWTADITASAPSGRKLVAGKLESWSRPGIPEQPDAVVVRHATVWTSGPRGRLENADLAVERGKITAVGKGLSVPANAVVIDGTGKHVTPGLIDAHSHTAISGGVNEGTQAVTAEVRIQDVVDPDDIAIYRELAGGLTCANLLHGSANPIGGQMCVIKLRWGGDAASLVFKAAAPGIKFALGENVKQSNWGDDFVTRYPQTRMGVEQILRDRFDAAREYAKRRAAKHPRIPPRRDLELEALAEVLAGTRKIHCHSYRQDEVLMLIRVADDFGFKVGTFQHILEGYKVADAIAAHGAHASTFSDWWAYKFEVVDAIPYNGALMHALGIVTSFNSDSAELARRMNLEAAKAVKYGGVPETEALRFVTLNPAKQLLVANRVGSLESGKDGDFVVWSGDPLSSYSICEQTWIDGRRYFDRAADLERRAADRAERARLVQDVLAASRDKDNETEGGKR